jgi:hypothetical protein
MNRPLVRCRTTAITKSARRTVLFAALLATLPMSVVSQAQVQEQEVPRQPTLTAVPMPMPQKMPTLGCCRCLGGENTLDLSTIPSNPWRVNGQPAAVVASPNPAWSTNTNGANWIAPSAAGNGGVNTTYHYTLQFKVEKCTIPQTIVFKGLAAAADNYIKVSLTGPSSGGPVQCNNASGYCFTAANQLNNFAAWPVTVAPGIYTLNVDVKNISGPTGMFISAFVQGRCAKEGVSSNKPR